MLANARLQINCLLHQAISLHWLYIIFLLALYQISPNNKFIILSSGGPKSNTRLTGLTSKCQEGSFLSGSSRRESVSLFFLEAAYICWLITSSATLKPAKLHLLSLSLPAISFSSTPSCFFLSPKPGKVLYFQGLM